MKAPPQDTRLFAPPCVKCKGRGKIFSARRGGLDVECSGCGGTGLEPQPRPSAPMTLEAHARKTDPTTSHAAAASLGQRELRASQVAVYEALLEGGPMTDTQLVGFYHDNVDSLHLPVQSESGIRTRRRELVDAGYVEDSGERLTLPPHQPAIVWQTKPKEA